MTKRTERFLLDDSRLVRWIVNDRRLDKVALRLLYIRHANCKFVALRLGVCEKVLDLIVLHRVLDGANHDSLFVARADFEALGEVYHCINERPVDAFMDVDALRGHADLEVW